MIRYHFLNSGSKFRHLVMSSCFLLMLASFTLAIQSSSIAAECSEISFMPAQTFLSYAKDTILDGGSGPLLDVHTFNQYFTFQIDPPEHPNPEPSSIEQSFITPTSSGEGFIIKVRSELSSAFSDQVQQGMRVTIIDKSSNDGGILIDSNSLDNDQGFIILEFDQLKDNTEYTLRYDLYDKEVVSNDDLAELTSGNTGIMCKLPFITQELLIMDKRLVKHRISQYNKNSKYDIKELNQGLKCGFDGFNNTLNSEYGEDGVFCQNEEYTYQVDNNGYSSYSSKPLSILYSHPFEVRGSKNELITYWYEMLIGYNFMVSSSLKVLLSRNDIEFNEDDPYKCLFDKSCVLATMGQKNQIKLDLILTSGMYKLMFIEEEPQDMKKFLTQDAGLRKRPITFTLTSYPVVQNEERYNIKNFLINSFRVNCPYMYIDNHFLQNRFIDGKGGRRFVMQDKVIMNVFNLTQQFEIKPEVDSILKIRIKESFGVNTAIVLNQGEDSLQTSTQVGTTELLFARLSKNVPYQIELSFAHSLIQASEFFTCPHFNLEVTMISFNEAADMVKKAKETMSSSNYESDSKLDDIFNAITDTEKEDGYVFIKHDQIFQFYVDQTQTDDTEDNLNYIVTAKRFITDERMQLFTEIYYEPYLFDLEISVFSTDVDHIRKHVNDNSYKKIDWTLYKGAKSLFMELEPGQYELRIVQKVPPTSGGNDLVKYLPKTVQFQLQVIFAEFIDRQQILPSTLNYFGLLGPDGKNFGEMVYHCQDCVLENVLYKTIDFTVGDDNLDINFNAMISSANRNIQIKLEQVDIGQDKNQLSYYDSQFQNEKRKGLQIGHKQNIGKGKTSSNEIEESISAEKLSSKVTYRVVIINNDPSTNAKSTFNLRLEFLEKPKSPVGSTSYKQILPKSIDEIKREKIRTEGLKESDFLIGTKFMLQWIDEQELYPFVRKSEKVYQTKYYDEDGTPFMVPLKFEVQEEEAMIFASVYDYSGISSLGLMITSAEDLEDEWEVISVPGKFHSYIPPIALTRGSYYLVVSPMTQFEYENTEVIKFGLDFLYERENVSDFTSQVMMNSMELCNIAHLPRTLDSPQYIHDLSGNTLSTVFRAKISDFTQDEMMYFTIKEQSLVNIYMELPKSVSGALELVKKQSSMKLKSTTKDLNDQMEIFLKSKQFKHQNVIQTRQFLSPGEYELRMSGSEADGPSEFGMPVCSYAKISLSASPITHAKSTLSEQCNQTTTMGNKLEFGKHITGNLIFNSGSQIIDTTYINLENQGEGPFFFYFQLNYDIQQEGMLGLTLNKYDRDTLLFEETQLYLVQDAQTFQLAVIDEGVYVLSIISMSSTKSKYVKGLGKSTTEFLLPDSCLNTTFSYYITSAINHDAQSVEFGLTDFIGSLFGLSNTFDDLEKQARSDHVMRDELSEILSPTCIYEEIPSKLPITESGYDLTYNFMFTRKPYEMIDVIVEEESLFKVQFNIENHKNSLNAFLYENSSMKNLVAFTQTTSVEKKFSVVLKPQKKAYKLKIVYDSLEEIDSCPTYQLRVALKPLALLPDENLKCANRQLPPSQIQITNKNFDSDGEYQFSHEFLQKYLQQNGASRDVTYDIEIKVPDKSKQYYFDIESKQDFLSTDVEFQLFGKNEKNNNALILLGSSIWYDENKGETSLVTNDNLIIHRLRLANIEEQLQLDEKLGDTVILRLRFSKKLNNLINTLKSKSLITDKKLACFTFDLSIRVSEVDHKEENYTPDTDPTENELIRIDWSTKMKDQLFDPRQKLSVFLQFKESMKEEYKTLKFSNFAFLYPSNLSNTEDYDKRIYPQTTRLSTVDKSTLILTFQHNALLKDTCYKLVLNKGELSVKFMDEDGIKDQNKICTTKCQCNPKGMKECNEKLGQCQCHHPYTGLECYQCAEGFVLNPTTQECEPTQRCVANGGKEDCNGHGECYEDENTGQAKCRCDQGFADDGLDLCGKCNDPLFAYPECYSRTWIVEPSDYNCGKLPTKLPVFLYNSTIPSVKPLQNSEGFLVWASIYKLSPPTSINEKKEKVKTSHYFTVQQNSIMRLFLDTHDSGVKVKFKVLDDKKKIVYQSAQKIDQNDDKDIMFLPLKQGDRDAKQYPFTLELEYEFIQSEYDQNSCPMLEIYMLIQPLNKIQEYLKCSQDQIAQSRETKQFHWSFGYDSQFFNEKFMLTSDMKAGDGQSYVKEENDQYIIMKYDITINQGGNALSVITTYSFEEVVLALTLTDKKTGNVIAIEKYASLEDIDITKDEITLTNDMITFLEIPSIEQGEYGLEVMLLKGLFIPRRNVLTCLSFDLAIEYVVRKFGKQSNQGDQNNYEVIAIMPNQANNLSKQKKQKVQVKFSRKINVNDFTGTDLTKVFALQSNSDQSNKIAPTSAMIQDHDTLSLFFNFKDQKVKQEEECFKLISQDPDLELKFDTKYCFMSQTQADNEVKCNPNALAKLVNNKCICNHPYKGATCEQCDDGFNPTLDLNKHTVCAMDLNKCSKDICNEHGTCTQLSHTSKLNDFKCQCYSLYDGMYCEKCKDPKLAYPDCDTIMSYDDPSTYLKERRYTQDGYQKSTQDFQRLAEGTHKEQCQIATYPRDLNRVEFMGVFGGEMHIADYYSINHDQDNLIKFIPKSQGHFKVFIQEPELEELKVNGESFDIEIGLYDPASDKFIATSVNSQLDFKDKSQLNGKMSYAILQTQIPYDQVGKTLYLIFRAVNHSVSTQETLAECEAVYIEVEYKEKTRECLHNSSIQFNSQLIRVDSQIPYKNYDDRFNTMNSNTFSVVGQYKSFFHYQDFYLGEQYNEDPETDYELKISVHQKFIERNHVDFLVEVLEEATPYNEIDFRKYQYQQDSPQCEKLCLISGQKAFNEFHNVVQVSAKSLIRVWLHQQARDGSCANYQLFLEANKISLNSNNQNIQSLNDVKCEELDLPQSLNVERYLGQQSNNAQKNFHYLERFRVDNLRNNSAHTIDFNLKEPTLVRIVASVHKHIEFDLVLRQKFVNNNKPQKKLIESSAKGYEDSIFAQLDEGNYQLQLLFLSEEYYLQQPCQSIQVEIAMAKVKEVKQQINDNMNILNSMKDTLLELPELLKHENRTMNVFKSKAVRAYPLNNQQQVSKSYSSYVELFSKKFIIPKTKDLGLLIQMTSDFTLNNVNFALSNINNNRVLPFTRRENMIQLIAENIPGGEYELLIYAHNCLSNIENQSNMLDNIDVSFQIDFNFIKWLVEDDFKAHTILLDITGDKSTQRIPVDVLSKSEYQCFEDYVFLSSELQGNILNGGVVDFNQEVMIPVIESMSHEMVYKVVGNSQSFQDGLRIIVDRSNTKVTIYKSSNKDQAVATGITTNNGQQAVIIAKNLLKGQEYLIVFEFNQDVNYQEFESQACQHFRVQIESFTTASQCQKFSGQPISSQMRPIELEGQQTKNIVINSHYLHTSQPIIMKENLTDVYVTIDYSDLMYVPTVRMLREIIKKDGVKAKVELKAVEINNDIKNQITYKFTNLKQITYVMNVTQYFKPKYCLNTFTVNVQSYRAAQGEVVLTRTSYGSIKTYTSQDEIQELNRFVQPLPITLNTYKYIQDEEYLLVSEYIQVNPMATMKENKISFKINNSDKSVSSFVRVHLENDELYMDLIDISTSKAVAGESQKRNNIVQLLPNGDYELQMEFMTSISQKKASLYKNTAHITISIINEKVFEDKYVKFQGSSLSKCENNKNLPLALNKRSDLQLTPNEIVYEYLYLRLSASVMKDNYILDTYKFRLNETSRFYMALGMHVVAHQAVLRLSDLNDYGMTYLGKQEFNLNLLDVVLAAGDYNLEIEQPILSTWHEHNNWSWLVGKSEEQKKKEGQFKMCGIFSFAGRITPMADIGQIKGESQSKCEIKEVLPTKIYKSVTKTKNGHESFINPDGTFSRVYENLLIKKTKFSQTMPDFDKLLVEVPEDGILSVMVQYKQKANQMMVRLFDALTFTDKSYDPIFTSQIEASNSMIEEQYGFKVVKNKEYFIFIYYQGERQFDPISSSEICEYYNAYLSIDTMKRLESELVCLSQEDRNANKDQKIYSFVSDIPQNIGDSDFKNGEYRFEGFTEFRFPEDYDKLAASPDEKGLEMKTINVKVSDKFRVESSIKFDFPYSLFDLNVFDNIKSEDNDPDSLPEDYQSVATQLPVQYLNGDIYNPTLMRQLKSSDLNANNMYFLTISDEASWFVMDTIYQTVKKPLCLYTEVSIIMTKQKSPFSPTVAQAQSPQIIKVLPQTESLAPFRIERTQNELSISVAVSSAPFFRGSEIKPNQKIATKAELAMIFSLNFFNSKSLQLEYSKRPARIIFDKNRNNQLTLVFNLQEEQQVNHAQALMRLGVDWNNLVDSKGQRFEVKQGVRFPEFIFEHKMEQDEQKQHELKTISDLDKIKNEIKNKTSKTDSKGKETVKCLCVHGQCKDGESECNRCDNGWSGKLCDTPVSGKNINNREGEESRMKQKLKKDGSRMAKPQDIEDYSDFKINNQDSNKKAQKAEGVAIETEWVTYKPPRDQSQTEQQRLISQQEQLAAAGNQRTFFGSLMKIIEDMSLVLVVILGIGALAYLLLKKSKLKDYLPVPLSENDDADQLDKQKSSMMELTEFKNSSNVRNRKATKKEQYNQLQQQESPDQLRTKSFPKDIRTTNQREQQQPSTSNFNPFDEISRELNSELELYHGAGEQDSAEMLKEQNSPPKYENQPQSVNELATSYEIANVLKEMHDYDDDDNDGHEDYGGNAGGRRGGPAYDEDEDDFYNQEMRKFV